MTQEKQRYLRDQALPVAMTLRETLGEACERIEIAGSLRRKLPTVGDIELLCVSKTGAIRKTPQPAEHQTTFDLGSDLNLPEGSWNDPEHPALEVAIQNLIDTGQLTKRPNKGGRFSYGPKNKLLLHVESGIPVDIFSTPEKNWGMALVVRTGSANFNKRLMMAFINKGMEGHAYGGVTVPDQGEFDCPTEQSVFDLLGWDFIKPEDRA